MDLSAEIDALIDLSLTEDIRSGDITTEALVPSEAKTSAQLFLRQAGVIAGFDILKRVFEKIDPAITITFHCTEGTFFKAGTPIATISGNARAILSGERVALNLLQTTSGIASLTAAYVKKVSGHNCAIMDTRKTLPGMRALQKYAVRIGGGKNHRFGLDDRLVIKTNHQAFLTRPAAQALQEALQKIKTVRPDLPIEIEINDPSLIDPILHTEIVAIMLRNMNLEDISKAVKKIRRTDKKVYVESANAITLEVVRAYAATGIDGIALGSLTHPAPALDIGMRLG